ncbi:MAG: response regulator [Spirochaetes bacterium]|nr:response regulator [Spirochaetota bacterium]MBU1082307.1 response regulator [Spirochaetota bacterium]
MEKAILLVDDEPLILLALRQDLRTELGPSFRYEIARDATEGLEAIEELDAAGVKVVLVISDWLMPGMKGDEFIELVRADHPDVKTVMVSGQVEAEHLDRLRSGGTLDAFFGKPWNVRALMRECRRLLSSSG